MIVCPFTLEASLLKLMPLVCGACIQEDFERALIEPPEIEWEPATEPLPQHWADIGYDPDANPQWYPIWEARPVDRTPEGDAIYRLGRLRKSDGSIVTPYGVITPDA